MPKWGKNQANEVVLAEKVKKCKPEMFQKGNYSASLIFNSGTLHNYSGVSHLYFCLFDAIFMWYLLKTSIEPTEKG